MCFNTILLVVALLVVTSANVLTENRIIGGSAARAGQFKHAAALVTSKNQLICGAAIINARWVVTGATCTLSMWAGDDSFTVRTGSLTYSSGGATHKIANIINHPEYVYNTRKNDISVVQTVTPIASNSNSAPIALPRSDVYNNAIVDVIGWGSIDQFNPAKKSSTLQHLSTPIQSNTECATALKTYNYNNLVKSTNFCTNGGYEQGICRGDSGSPVSLNNELVGIVSFGVSCAVGVPDVHTRVFKYVDWINQNTRY